MRARTARAASSDLVNARANQCLAPLDPAPLLELAHADHQRRRLRFLLAPLDLGTAVPHHDTHPWHSASPSFACIRLRPPSTTRSLRTTGRWPSRRSPAQAAPSSRPRTRNHLACPRVPQATAAGLAPVLAPGRPNRARLILHLRAQTPARASQAAHQRRCLTNSPASTHRELPLDSLLPAASRSSACARPSTCTWPRTPPSSPRSSKDAADHQGRPTTYVARSPHCLPPLASDSAARQTPVVPSPRSSQCRRSSISSRTHRRS
jgi:hypothetical protein